MTRCGDANDEERAAARQDSGAGHREQDIDSAAPVAGAAALPVVARTAHAVEEKNGEHDGSPEPDPELRDTENVPLEEDMTAYFVREVKPHCGKRVFLDGAV